MRRGFELQFHWIFVLVAGSLIVLFFFSVAQRQQSLSEERLSLSLVSDLEDIFVGALSSKGVAQSFAVPSVVFECSEGCDCGLRVGGAFRSLGDRPIFAESKLADEAVAWSLEWDIPFRASNFLFVASPFTKFVLVGSESNPFLAGVRRVFPSDLSVDVVSDVSLVRDDGFDSVVLVLFGGSGDVVLPESLNGISVRGVRFGSVVEFLEQHGSSLVTKFSSGFGGVPSMVGAVVSDSGVYECSSRSALLSLSRVASVYASRARLLDDFAVSSGSSCVYSSSIAALESLRDVSVGADVSSWSYISSSSSSLLQLNRALVQRSCPGLF